MPHILNKEILDDIVSFILQALQEKDSFVYVNGGFESLFTSEYNIRKYRFVDSTRGSEAATVWEYLTLKKENKLEGSEIPNWFWDERWLIAYANYHNSKIVYKKDVERKPPNDLLEMILEYLDPSLFEKDRKLYAG